MAKSNTAIIEKFMAQLADNFRKQSREFKGLLTRQLLITIVNDYINPEIQRKYQQVIDLLLQQQGTVRQQQQQIEQLKQKIKIQEQMTFSMIRAIRKEYEDKGNHSHIRGTQKKQSILLKNMSQLVPNYDSSDKSPIYDFKDQVGLKGEKSRTKLSKSRYQSSQFANQLEQKDDKEKTKAFAKLRKLQMYVYGRENKENMGRKQKNEKIWDYGVSPTKKYYEEENNSLKAIQQNLLTHLSLLEKFKGIPSIQSLISREQIIKKKQRQLNEKAENLEQKELELNKKHAQILKNQRTSKIL